MSLQAKVKRYSLIIDHVKRLKYPSFRDIHNMLNDYGFGIDSRTLQRDIEDIRDEFGVEITYDTGKKGYYIDYENSINADYVLHFLELAVSSDIMIDSVKEGKKVLKYIDFDSYEHFRGVNNIGKLLSALKESRKVSFLHTSYQTEITKHVNLAPYLLKEYQGRWYIYGEDLSIHRFRIYGLDRIDNLQISNEKFEQKKDFDPSVRFADMIGISSSWDDIGIQEVILSFTDDQWKYFEAFPWFSYKPVKGGKNDHRVSLTIIPNTELIQIILKHSEGVTVIEPADLRNRIKEILEDACKRY